MAREIVAIRNLATRMPEQGRIRIGEKGTKGNPVKLTEFRFTSSDESAVHAIAERYGGKPRPWDGAPNGGEWEVKTEASEIPIALPPDPLGGTPMYELWSGGGLVRRCDGETCHLPVASAEGGEMDEAPCVCVAQQALACKPKTRLTVILREIPFGGGWRLESGGWNVAHEMPGMVDMIQSLESRGLVTGVLALEQRTSKANGKTRKFVVPVLRPSVSVDELLAGAGRLKALSAPTAALARVDDTPEPVTPEWYESVDEEIVDAEIVEEEHHQADTPTVVPSSTSDDVAEQVKLRRQMHAIINEILFSDTERHALVRRVSEGKFESSNDLSNDQLKKMIFVLKAIKDGKASYQGEDEKGWAKVVTA